MKPIMASIWAEHFSVRRRDDQRSGWDQYARAFCNKYGRIGNMLYRFERYDHIDRRLIDRYFGSGPLARVNAIFSSGVLTDAFRDINPDHRSRPCFEKPIRTVPLTACHIEHAFSGYKPTREAVPIDVLPKYFVLREFWNHPLARVFQCEAGRNIILHNRCPIYLNQLLRTQDDSCRTGP
jgi:hypothetical protein